MLNSAKLDSNAHDDWPDLYNMRMFAITFRFQQFAFSLSYQDVSWSLGLSFSEAHCLSHLLVSGRAQ